MDKKHIPLELEKSALMGRSPVESISRKNISSMSEDDIVELLFNLETQQIELQMQNDELKKVQNILVDMRDQYTELYDFAPVGYVTLSLKGIISKSNLTFCKMLESSRSVIQGQPFFDLISQDSHDNYYLFLNRILSSDDDSSCELQLQNSQGDRFWVQLTGACFKSPNEEDIHIRLVIIHYDQQKQNIQLIKTLSQAVDQSPVSVIITDTQGVIEYVNHAFEKISGYTRDESIGKDVVFLKSDQTAEADYFEMIATINNGKSWKGQLQNRRKNGDVYWEDIHVAPVFNEQGIVSHYISVNEDIMQRKMQEEQIQHQAHYDALTDLPNRFLVLDRLSHLIVNATRKKGAVALLFLDLDGFKKVNDTLGHEVGDKLLIESARLLRQAVRTGDTIGRLGGDEFIILLEGIKEESDIIPVAKNILKHFRRAFEIEGKEILVTISIGIAVYPDDGNSASELLRNADSAMYCAKEMGRNTYSFYTSSMNHEVERRLLVEAELYEALKREEFHVCYQPLVDIKNRRISGFEALLRWNNKNLGPIKPLEFITIAEQSGHIVSIGQFVFKQAVVNLGKWQKRYKQNFSIAVNLSPNQFRDPELMSFIIDVIEQASIVNGTLELEITEGVLMSGKAIIDKPLQSIKQLGLGISMDDFGTGFSSLNYLRLYPFDSLKIDRSFVRDMTIDKENRDLVNAAITMAHSLGLKVIAEGVETQEQLARLSERGCDIAQGYLFSKPLTESGLEDFLESNETSGFIEQQFLN